jgi:hypothetical protein
VTVYRVPGAADVYETTPARRRFPPLAVSVLVFVGGVATGWALLRGATPRHVELAAIAAEPAACTDRMVTVGGSWGYNGFACPHPAHVGRLSPDGHSFTCICPRADALDGGAP